MKSFREATCRDKAEINPAESRQKAGIKPAHENKKKLAQKTVTISLAESYSIVQLNKSKSEAESTDVDDSLGGSRRLQADAHASAMFKKI